MPLTSSTKLLRMLKLLWFQLVFQERSVSHSVLCILTFDCLLFSARSKLELLFCSASFLVLTSSISADDSWWSIQRKGPFWKHRGGWWHPEFLDQRIHCPWPRSSRCPSCPNCTHSRHFEPCQLNRSHCCCNSRESWCLWSQASIRYHHTRRCPCCPLHSRSCRSFSSWHPCDRCWWTQWGYHCSSSFTILFRQSYHWWEIREACASHSVRWRWSRESQGWSWECNPVYGLRWCQIHQLPSAGIERRKGCYHTHLC